MSLFDLILKVWNRDPAKSATVSFFVLFLLWLFVAIGPRLFAQTVRRLFVILLFLSVFLAKDISGFIFGVVPQKPLSYLVDGANGDTNGPKAKAVKPDPKSEEIARQSFLRGMWIVLQVFIVLAAVIVEIVKFREEQLE